MATTQQHSQLATRSLTDLPPEDVFEDLGRLLPGLELQPGEVAEQGGDEGGVVHLLGELRQHDVALLQLVTVMAEQQTGDGEQMLADLVLSLLHLLATFTAQLLQTRQGFL